MDDACGQVFRHIEFMTDTILKMIETLEEDDLLYRPDPSKRSLGELLAHIALICEADTLISDEATEEEMAAFYSSSKLETLPAIRSSIIESMESLRSRYDLYTATSLSESTTSWWGATYTRFGWLVQILTHLAHHRGQLHSMMVRMGKDPQVHLFE